MTKRCLSVRLREHATQVSNSAIGKHFSDCEHPQYLTSLQNQFSLLNDIPLPSGNVPSPIENLVFNNFRILHLPKSTNYTRKNAQVITSLQTNCNKSVHKLSTSCVRAACS